MMRLLVAALTGSMIMAAPAHAYLDGATASIVLQAIIGFFAAWGLYSRRAIGWVKNLFNRTADQSEQGE